MTFVGFDSSYVETRHFLGVQMDIKSDRMYAELRFRN